MNTPDFNTLRSGKPDCPSDFALDRLAVGAAHDSGGLPGPRGDR